MAEEESGETVRDRNRALVWIGSRSQTTPSGAPPRAATQADPSSSEPGCKASLLLYLDLLSFPSCASYYITRWLQSCARRRFACRNALCPLVPARSPRLHQAPNPGSVISLRLWPRARLSMTLLREMFPSVWSWEILASTPFVVFCSYTSRIQRKMIRQTTASFIPQDLYSNRTFVYEN